ncbi:Crp/Fnr family transcriptional regulator [Roseovarius sp. TE539]|uniref:Crp/Fnr family transcriptional regulator n=1 Tax=Roseovarius sp. TE539 TaxID=2249812 RepID=UPI000DFDF244|nr:Crp/Fnr family transcriptional regulator [Roseovarius sp. TE539]RBI71536.1 Crp/Fnr family transcriptional regulator [Roseovarius sp. TE539]
MPGPQVETTEGSKAPVGKGDFLFPGTSPDLRQLLKTHHRGFRAGSILKVEAEESGAIYCLLSGWLALSKLTEDGERQIIDVILPGEIVHPSSADSHTSWIQIETLCYATVAVVPQAAWARLEAADPCMRRIEAVTIAASLSRMSERMLRLGKGTAESRIAYALTEICIRLKAIGESDVCDYHLPMTQQDLGDFVGLSSVHVCRTLRRLSRSGVISTADHMDITIHDLDRLAGIAGVDLDRLRAEIISAR